MPTQSSDITPTGAQTASLTRDSRSLNRLGLAATAFAGALFVVYLIASLRLGLPEARYSLALAVPAVIAPLCIIAGFVARARTGVPLWGTMGLSTGIYGVACALGSVGHSPRPDALPFLMGAGICFTLASALFIACLLGFTGGPLFRFPCVPSADGLLVLAACAAVSWCVALGPIAATDAIPRHIQIFETIYLVEDTLLVLASVLLIHQGGGRRLPIASAGHLAAGFACLVIGDVVDCCAIKMPWAGGFTLAGGFWLIGMLQFILAAGKAKRPVRLDAIEPAARVEPAWSFAAATITLISTVLILLCEVAARGTVGPASLAVAGGLMAAYLVRQWVGMSQTTRLLRQNVAYSERLEGFNAELEETVDRRTRYLRALHAITAATRATLDESEVIRLCLKGTVEALRAEGGCVVVDERGEPACVLGNAGPMDAVRERVRQWRASEPLSPAGDVFTLLGFAGNAEEPLAQIIVWRHTYDFSDEDNELIDSVGLELEAALHNARVHEQAAAAADRDPLTGLLNHRAIHQRLSSELSRSRREGRPLAAMMLDLDDFKIFNDTFGHPVGDEVLRQVSATILASIRDFDLAGRYGGDEFVLVLPGADRDTARQIGDRIRASLYESGFEGAGGETPLRITFGVAVCPDEAMNRKELLAMADADLYRAKQLRGGAVHDGAHLRAGLESMPSFAALDALVLSLDQRDRYTRRHSEDVTRYALAMAEALGWSDQDLQSVRIAGLLHDVGKVGVPEHLLRKPGVFSAEETEAMRRHPELGYMLARPLEAGPLVEDGIRRHHERWDGRGYPNQLAGTDIPAIARLLAVADAFSAMTTHRPYRRAKGELEALRTLFDGAGSQWDPAMVEALAAACPALGIRVPAHELV